MSVVTIYLDHLTDMSDGEYLIQVPWRNSNNRVFQFKIIYCIKNRSTKGYQVKISNSNKTNINTKNIQ